MNRVPRVAAVPPHARILSLKVSNFRSYRAAALDTGGGSVLLLGANGAGKTNLLEAISFLTQGRGLRRATLEDVAAIDYGEEYVLELCPLEDGDVRAGRQMGAIGVVDGQVARLMQIPPQRIQVALHHPLGTFSELLVDEIGYSKTLGRGLGWSAREGNGHAMLL